MEHIVVDKYAILAAACGIAQLAALVIFPYVSKHFNRKTLYGYFSMDIIGSGARNGVLRASINNRYGKPAHQRG